MTKEDFFSSYLPDYDTVDVYWETYNNILRNIDAEWISVNIEDLPTSIEEYVSNEIFYDLVTICYGEDIADNLVDYEDVNIVDLNTNGSFYLDLGSLYSLVEDLEPSAQIKDISRNHILSIINTKYLYKFI